jgi:hypothetical protein
MVRQSLIITFEGQLREYSNWATLWMTGSTVRFFTLEEVYLLHCSLCIGSRTHRIPYTIDTVGKVAVA